MRALQGVPLRLPPRATHLALAALLERGPVRRSAVRAPARGGHHPGGRRRGAGVPGERDVRATRHFYVQYARLRPESGAVHRVPAQAVRHSQPPGRPRENAAGQRGEDVQRDGAVAIAVRDRLPESERGAHAQHARAVHSTGQKLNQKTSVGFKEQAFAVFRVSCSF
ncbi:hypothetical protein FOCC_FOCC002771 [Frankliniella occidentalis]|nr:hypothetical protein FOCC_FOCC002771 [Frankliniella occidentalis]